MTKAEFDALTTIANEDGWKTRPLLREYLDTVSITEEKKNTRTTAQNRALHLWFEQIAHTCNDAGIDGHLLFSKTVSFEVNKETIKALWHGLQNALYGTGSTTELDRHAQINKLQDHLIRFFAERHELELPPFPKLDLTPDYPRDFSPPLI